MMKKLTTIGLSLLIMTAFTYGQFADSLNISKSLYVADKSDLSVKKAVLMSAVVPGAGQYYSGSKIASAVYFTVELAAIAASVSYQRRGDAAVDDYLDFADLHWDVNTWLQGYYDEGATEQTHNVVIIVEQDGSEVHYDFVEFKATFPDYADFVGLSIDVIKDYHFYENIGKYKEFKQGWDDYLEYRTDPDYINDIQKSSPNQDHYTDMRYDANYLLKTSGYFSTAVLFNHVISAFDAGFRVKFKNNKNVDMKLVSVPLIYYHNPGAMLNLSLSW